MPRKTLCRQFVCDVHGRRLSVDKSKTYGRPGQARPNQAKGGPLVLDDRHCGSTTRKTALAKDKKEATGKTTFMYSVGPPKEAKLQGFLVSFL